MPYFTLNAWPGVFSKTVNLDPDSIAAAAGTTSTLTVTQTFTTTSDAELTGLKPGRPTFCWFKNTPTAGIALVGAACYTKNVLSLTFTNNTAGIINLAAQDFVVVQL